MGAVKGWLMDLEQKFWEDSEDIIKESETFTEALMAIREKLTYPAIQEDNDHIEDQLADLWEEIWSKHK